MDLDVDLMEWLSANNRSLLEEMFLISALDALIYVGKKYKFTIDEIEEERRKHGDIPVLTNGYLTQG